jgi:hypothetical protein
MSPLKNLFSAGLSFNGSLVAWGIAGCAAYIYYSSRTTPATVVTGADISEFNAKRKAETADRATPLK